jgi:hypothetical protein
MIKKTFVEWCKEYRTPKSDTEFWSMTNTGLHITDKTPTGIQTDWRNSFAYHRIKTEAALEQWRIREQRRVMDSMILTRQKY